MARILLVIDLPDQENRPREATDLAVRLRDHCGSVTGAAAAVGVTRQAFHEWLTGHHVTVRHIVAMTALLATAGLQQADTSVDADTASVARYSFQA
jgi:hypothetical protein